VDTLIGSLAALLEGHAATRELARLTPPDAHLVTRLFLEAAGHRPARGRMDRQTDTERGTK
jgi:hypothetical protein